MIILFDATVLEIPFTGVAKSTLYLYENCHKLNPDIRFNGFIQKAPFAQPPGIINLHLLQKRMFSPLYSEKTIDRVVKAVQPDVIHFPWHGGVPVKFRNVKTVMTLHDVLPLEIPEFFRSAKQKKDYQRRLQGDIDRCDVIFTDSLYSKKQIESNFRVGCELLVNYLAPTLSKCESNGYKKLDFDYFIYVGGYAARKGLDSLIKAFVKLHESKKTSCKLLFTGTPLPVSNDFSRLMELGKRSGIIEERGYVPDEELSFLISNSIGLLYLSKYEGFGLPPLDAMSLGCPVVTTRYSSLPEICGDAVIYVEPNDIDAVAEQMLLLEKTPVLRDELSHKGLTQSLSFSWEKTAGIFMDHVFA